MNRERALIHDFYAAFQNKDAETMASCYHPDIEFTDPVFGRLRNDEPAMMWRMLIERSKGKKLDIVYRLMECNDKTATVEWEAHYEFSGKRRLVHNKITASLRFKDGKIINHYDYFDFHAWASMALGWPGRLLGWTPFFKNKVRGQVRHTFEKFMKEKEHVA